MIARTARSASAGGFLFVAVVGLTAPLTICYARVAKICRARFIIGGTIIGSVVEWLLYLGTSVGRRLVGQHDPADDHSRMSYADVWRKMRAMGEMRQLPGESLVEWKNRIQPMMDVYHAWGAAWRADPANYPPGEWAMRNYLYDKGDKDEALAELLSAGFAERAPSGETVLNKEGSKLAHQIRMYDR